MVEFRSDIDAALSGDGPIPKARVISWIEAATDSDLSTLSKLYRLTGEGYYRIQPELGRENDMRSDSAIPPRVHSGRRDRE